MEIKKILDNTVKIINSSSNVAAKKLNSSNQYSNTIETINIDVSYSGDLDKLYKRRDELRSKLPKNGEASIIPSYVFDELQYINALIRIEELKNEIDQYKNMPFPGYEMEMLDAQNEIKQLEMIILPYKLNKEINELEYTIDDLKDRVGYEMELLDAQNRLKYLENELVWLEQIEKSSIKDKYGLYLKTTLFKNNLLPQDFEMIEILYHNPRLQYIGVEKHTTNYDTEINAYKVYDSKNDITYYIQQDFNAHYNINSAFNAVDKMSQYITLTNANKGSTIVLTSISCPNNELSSKQYGRDFFAAASCNSESGEITFWKECDDSNVYGTLCHETGHSLDRNFQYSNSSEYAEAVTKDGNFVSDYAEDSYYILENKYCEDFAESIEYIAKNGPEKFKENFPNRAEYFIKLVPDTFD